MTLRDITASEWLILRQLRAQKLTGFHVHSVPFIQDKPSEPVSYYIWKMGGQPSGAVLKSLLAGCPLKAAEKFLAAYAPNRRRNGDFNLFHMPEALISRKAIAEAKGGAA